MKKKSYPPTPTTFYNFFEFYLKFSQKFVRIYSSRKLNRKFQYFPDYISNKDEFIYFTCQILNGNNKNLEKEKKRSNLDSISK